jgi:hypothetical protein
MYYYKNGWMLSEEEDDHDYRPNATCILDTPNQYYVDFCLVQ